MLAVRHLQVKYSFNTSLLILSVYMFNSFVQIHISHGVSCFGYCSGNLLSQVVAKYVYFKF